MASLNAVSSAFIAFVVVVSGFSTAIDFIPFGVSMSIGGMWEMIERILIMCENRLTKHGKIKTVLYNLLLAWWLTRLISCNFHSDFFILALDKFI